MTRVSFAAVEPNRAFVDKPPLLFDIHQVNFVVPEQAQIKVLHSSPVSMVQRPMKDPLVFWRERSEVVVGACCTITCYVKISVLFASLACASHFDFFRATNHELMDRCPPHLQERSRRLEYLVGVEKDCASSIFMATMSAPRNPVMSSFKQFA